MILAGDIGGTKSNFALFEAASPGRVGRPSAEETFPTASATTFPSLIEAYRARHPEPISAAAFGVAGPVVASRARGTNLPWEIDAASAARSLGLPRVGLVNDLIATGYGIPALLPEDLETLQAGDPAPDGNISMIAAGTGLGEATLARHGDDWIPVASEGGHADFAPRTDEEIDLLRDLRSRYGRVSYERVLSGPGLADLARWLHARGGNERGWTSHEADALRGGDLPGTVSRLALERACPDCVRALDLFVSVYGAEAANLALRGVATAGVYLGGGIAPKILPALREGRFLEAFRDKEPHRDLLSRVPVHVIRNQRAAVLGAARVASLGL